MTPIEQGLAAIRAAVVRMTEVAAVDLTAKRAAMETADELDRADLIGQIGALEGAQADFRLLTAHLDARKYTKAVDDWFRGNAIDLPGGYLIHEILDRIATIRKAEEEIREAVASLERLEAKS